MPLVSMRELLDHAAANSYGIPAFNVNNLEQVQAVMRIADEHAIPVTVSAGRSNVTGAALPLRGGIVLDLCELNRFIAMDIENPAVDYVALSKSFGLPARRVTRARDIAPAIEEGIASGRANVVEVMIGTK